MATKRRYMHGRVFSHARGLENIDTTADTIEDVFSHTRGLEIDMPPKNIHKKVFSHIRGLEMK